MSHVVAKESFAAPRLMRRQYRNHGLQPWLRSFAATAAKDHLMLFIHFNIGSVTDLSGVFGEKTRDIWLWSLKNTDVGQRPALQSAVFKASSKVRMFCGSI